MCRQGMKETGRRQRKANPPCGPSAKHETVDVENCKRQCSEDACTAKHAAYLLDDLTALLTAPLGFLHFLGVLALGILLGFLVGITLLFCVADQSVSQTGLGRGRSDSKCSLGLRNPLKCQTRVTSGCIRQSSQLAPEGVQRPSAT